MGLREKIVCRFLFGKKIIQKFWCFYFLDVFIDFINGSITSLPTDAKYTRSFSTLLVRLSRLESGILDTTFSFSKKELNLQVRWTDESDLKKGHV